MNAAPSILSRMAAVMTSTLPLQLYIMWNSEEPAATKHAQHAHELLWGIFYSKIDFYRSQNIYNSQGDRLGFIKPYHNCIVGERLARVTRRLLKQGVNFGHLAMHILYKTQCCSTTREVIAASLHCKHWIYLLGQAKSVCSWQKILTRPPCQYILPRRDTGWRLPHNMSLSCLQ